MGAYGKNTQHTAVAVDDRTTAIAGPDSRCRDPDLVVLLPLHGDLSPQTGHNSFRCGVGRVSTWVPENINGFTFRWGKIAKGQRLSIDLNRNLSQIIHRVRVHNGRRIRSAAACRDGQLPSSVDDVCIRKNA